MRFIRRNRALATAAAGALVLSLAIPGGVALASSSPGTHPAAPASSKIPHYKHIAVLQITDHGLTDLLHNKFAPTYNKLAREYGLATEYTSSGGGDVGGEMALLTGKPSKANDSVPYWDNKVGVASILSQLTHEHMTWKEYAQNMPYAGYLGVCYPIFCTETDTLYNQMQFDAIPDLSFVSHDAAQARNLVPYAELKTDSKSGKLPNFIYIQPNECTEMHGGPPYCQDSPNNLGQRNDNDLVSQGDAFAKQVVSTIMSGKQWKQGNNAIVLTATSVGRSFTVVITSHGPRHLKDATPFTQYSLTATIEDAFRLHCLGSACSSTLNTMGRLFGASKDGTGTFPNASLASQTGTHAAPATPSADQYVAPATSASPNKGARWTIVKSPNVDKDANDNDLWSISGNSPKDIWAVGSDLPTPNSTIVQTLAEHYNGKTWKIVKTPDTGTEANSLYGITVLKDGTAWATGIFTQGSGHTSHALAMHWNGHHWKIVPVVNPGRDDDILYSAASVNDREVFAAGTYEDNSGFFHPLLERWNGKRWTRAVISGLKAHTRGILTEVSADGHGVWATGQVVAGRSDRQVLLHLVGGRWTVASGHTVTTPTGRTADAFPLTVAGSAAGPWVAGNDRAGHFGYQTLVESPVGASGKLHELKTPNPTAQDNYVQAIAPVDGGTHAWAVGYSISPKTTNPLSLIMFGSRKGGWHMIKAPEPVTSGGSGSSILDGIIAFGPTNIWAVGTGSPGMSTFIVHYHG
jgi:hypothetical protein